ncbi:OVALX protein, partial [Rhodinocichla rosea]|nr:OVALX protein [Rhodinocichla rosea]
QVQDFLEPSSVNPQTVLVLVNAIYFKGKWKTPFKEDHTEEVPFNVTEKDDNRMTFRNYSGWGFTFMIALTEMNGRKKLDLHPTCFIPCLSLQLENKISFEKLAEWTSSKVMEKKRVKVYLPRMKIEEKYNLTSVLTSLGMTDLFSPSANLSGISAAESLRVSEAIHEAHMEVTEEGTEEGTGSADDTEDIQYSSEFEEFRADHPFLFLIKHNPSNLILFFGRYYYP